MVTKGRREARFADPRKETEAVWRTLERAVSAVCPRWLADQREDIVQAAMLKVLAAGQGEQNRLLTRSYLWRVAYCATADEIRQRRRMAIPMDAAALEQKSGAAPGGPFHDRQTRELGRAVRGCLMGVVAARRVVVQFHLQGHNLAEIEALTGWPGKRVRNLLYRGMADLRACLAAQGYTP